jgi:hypothetical protein
MKMDEMYNAMPGSPITYLAGDISAGQTTIAIADDTALPDAPNICTIGYGEHIETVRYGAKSNGVLQDVTRGIEGTPRAWQAGTEVARFFTAYDHNAIVENILAAGQDLATHQAESVSDAHGFEIEDGVFIPNLTDTDGSGIATYNSRSGVYQRNGNIVQIKLLLDVSAYTNASGYFEITGLPFVGRDTQPYDYLESPINSVAIENLDTVTGCRVVGDKISLRVADGRAAKLAENITDRVFFHISGTYTIRRL